VLISKEKKEGNEEALERKRERKRRETNAMRWKKNMYMT